MGSTEENSISKISIGQVESEATLLQPEAGLGFQVSASTDSFEPPVPTSYGLDELPTVLATHNQECDGHLSSESKEDSDEELQYQRLIIEDIQNFVLEERERESKEDADYEEYTVVVEEDDYEVYADHGKHETEDAQGDNGFEEGNIGEDLTEEYGEEDGYADEDDGAESPQLDVSKHVKYERPTYPVRRSDPEDCAHYMRTGTCRFGSYCKFNHPPSRMNQASKDRRHDGNSERMGQIECKYYLMPGGCKYGNTCKFKHDGGNTPYPPHNHSGGEAPFSPMVQFNFLGLPVNREEKDCPYYMRTGTCKYGASCRFNHPDPSSAGKGDFHSGYNAKGSVSQGIIPQPALSSWSSPNESGPLTTMFPPRQLTSVGPQWNSFQAPNVYPTGGSTLPIPPALALSNPMSETNFHMYHNQQQVPNVYPTGGSTLPIPPALALSNPMSETNYHMYHNQQQIVASEYPERPGQPECSYFMKTGSCKYKFSCKFHHPRHHLPKITNGAHNEKGLPLRSDRPICTHYGRYGICKSGPTCEYDHPANYSQSAFSSSPMHGLDTQFGNLAVNYRENGSSNPGGYFIKPQIQPSF